MDHLLCGISLERLSARCVRHLADRWGADLTSKSDEYRAKARECQKHAEQTRDPFIKQQLLDIAEKWRTMAAYEEKYAR
jgi:hypothetical protein